MLTPSSANDLLPYLGVLFAAIVEGEIAYIAASTLVAQGQLDAAGVFRANEVLAKHDENYMPPEAKEAVDKARQASKTLKP